MISSLTVFALRQQANEANMSEHVGHFETPPQVKGETPRTVSFPLSDGFPHKMFNSRKVYSVTKTEWTPSQLAWNYPPMTSSHFSDRDDDEEEGDEENCMRVLLPIQTSTCRRFLSVVSIATFLWAAVVGVATNLAPLWSSHLHRYVLPTAGTIDYAQQPRSSVQRVLYRTYHEHSNTAQAFATTTTTTGSGSDRSERPKLVIHMGPQKTASTALQSDLTYYQDRLQLDNYVYLGRYYRPSVTNGQLKLNRSPDSVLQTYFRYMFRNCWRAHKKQCVEDLRDKLIAEFQKPYQQALPNLLVSEETFLKLYDDTDTNNITPTVVPSNRINKNYDLLANVLGRDWDVVIILAYRRFFEWLPSAKYQKDKPTLERQRSEWPRTKTKNSGGIPLQPLFPKLQPLHDVEEELDTQTRDMLDVWRREHFFSDHTMHTLRLLTTGNAANSTFQIKIFHLYGKLSVRTNFFCNVLPQAEHSCRASRHQDDLQRQETRINKREETCDDSDTGTIQYPFAFFDAMAVSAAPLIDTATWKRQTVARMLNKHYCAATAIWQHGKEKKTQPLEEAANNNDALLEGNDDDSEPQTGTIVQVPVETIINDNFHEPNPWELPLICPTERQLDQLLHMSLKLEARYLPKLYRKAAAEHRAAFYSAIKTSPEYYCWIDTDALLSSDQHNRTTLWWKDYILEMFAGPAESTSK